MNDLAEWRMRTSFVHVNGHLIPQPSVPPFREWHPIELTDDDILENAARALGL